MKKTISLLLSVIMIFSCMSVMSVALEPEYVVSGEVMNESTGKSISWGIDRNFALTITGSGAMPDFTDLPAWSEYTYTSVIIGNGITHIGDNAFRDSAVTSVKFGEDAASVGSQSFMNCTSLTSLKFPESIREIGERAFYGCESLSDVVIPEGALTLKDFAFYGCTSLMYVVIPESVTLIEDCSLGFFCDVSLDDEFAKVNGFTIRGYAVSASESYAADNGFTFLDIKSIDNLFSYTLEDGTATLTSFTDSNLESVFIPSEIDGYAVTGLSSYLFSGTTIKSVIIPKSVTSIDKDAFSEAGELKTIVVDMDNAAYSSVQGALYNKAETELLKYPECKTDAPVFPTTLVKISDGAFSRVSLDSITLTSSITEIGSNAFAFSAIKSITMTDSVTKIGEWAFLNCTELENVYFSAGLTEISDGAFYGCSSLTDINLPDFLETIGSVAFYGINNIKSVTIPASVTEIGEHAFGYYEDNDIEFTKTDGFTVYADNGTIAESYAVENGFIFVDTKLDTVVLNYAYADNNCITVSWEKISNADGYIVYRKLSDASSWSKLCVIGGADATYYCDFNVSNGKTYVYTVRATGFGKIGECDKEGVSAEFIKLSAPVMVSASFIKTGINVKWNKVSGAEGYTLYRKVDSGSWQICAELSADTASFLDTSAPSGKKCTYTVAAYSGTVESAYDAVGVSATFLSVPILTGASNTTKGVCVKWKTVSGATGYYIGRKTADGSWVKIATVKAVNSYVDTTAKAGTAYTYTVAPFKGSVKGYFDEKGVTYTFIATPKLTACVNTVKGISLKWNTVSYASGYVIYRKSGSSGYQRIATLKGQKISSYVDTKAKSGTKYTYTVRAYRGSYYSSFYSNGMSVLFLSTPKVSSAVSSKAGITVKWNKITAANGYYLYRKENSGKWVRIATLKGNTKISYVDKSAKKGVTYTYTVRAYNGSYVSSYYGGMSCKDKY